MDRGDYAEATKVESRRAKRNGNGWIMGRE